MFTIGPRYSFGCPAVFTIVSYGILWCSAVFCSFQAYPERVVLELTFNICCWSSTTGSFRYSPSLPQQGQGIC